jgi:hypothetical protein
MTTTTAEMQLQMAIEAAEQFMKKAPYLGYDHAKISAYITKRISKENRCDKGNCQLLVQC